MSAIDILHDVDGPVETVTITVGDRWIMIPASDIPALVGELQTITPA